MSPGRFAVGLTWGGPCKALCWGELQRLGIAAAVRFALSAALSPTCTAPGLLRPSSPTTGGGA